MLIAKLCVAKAVFMSLTKLTHALKQDRVNQIYFLLWKQIFSQNLIQLPSWMFLQELNFWPVQQCAEVKQKRLMVWIIKLWFVILLQIHTQHLLERNDLLIQQGVLRNSNLSSVVVLKLEGYIFILLNHRINSVVFYCKNKKKQVLKIITRGGIHIVCPLSNLGK